MEQLQTMLNYTNELALPNISNFGKHSEREVHDGGAAGGEEEVGVSRRRAREGAQRGETEELMLPTF